MPSVQREIEAWYARQRLPLPAEEALEAIVQRAFDRRQAEGVAMTIWRQENGQLVVRRFDEPRRDPNDMRVFDLKVEPIRIEL